MNSTNGAPARRACTLAVMALLAMIWAGRAAAQSGTTPFLIGSVHADSEFDAPSGFWIKLGPQFVHNSPGPYIYILKTFIDLLRFEGAVGQTFYRTNGAWTVGAPGKLTPAQRQELDRQRQQQLTLKTNLSWQDRETKTLVDQEKTGLPRLLTGNVTCLGRSDPTYNCYAWAADPRSPLRWVGPRGTPTNPLPPQPGDIPVPSRVRLFEIFASKGWFPVEQGWRREPGDTVVVLYGTIRADGDFDTQHAAWVSPHGVYSKMGPLGLFRFDRIDQLVGPKFGLPYMMLRQQGSVSDQIKNAYRSLPFRTPTAADRKTIEFPKISPALVLPAFEPANPFKNCNTYAGFHYLGYNPSTTTSRPVPGAPFPKTPGQIVRIHQVDALGTVDHTAIYMGNFGGQPYYLQTDGLSLPYVWSEKDLSTLTGYANRTLYTANPISRSRLGLR